MRLPWPSSIAHFSQVFPDEAACREYLIACRWPHGFRCPVCGHGDAWSAYLVATLPDLNARTLGRHLNVASHRTRCFLLDRSCRSMTALSLPLLTGVIEADEMALGGVQPGRRGFAGANKSIVLVLVQRGSSRTRLVEVPDRRGGTLLSLISKLVEPDSPSRIHAAASYAAGTARHPRRTERSASTSAG